MKFFLVACVLFASALSISVKVDKEFEDLSRYSTKLDLEVEIKRNITVWKTIPYGWVRTTPYYYLWKKFIFYKYGFYIECDNDVVYNYFKDWMKNNVSFTILKKYKWFWTTHTNGAWNHDDLESFSCSSTHGKGFRTTNSKLIIGDAN